MTLVRKRDEYGIFSPNKRFKSNEINQAEETKFEQFSKTKFLNKKSFHNAKLNSIKTERAAKFKDLDHLELIHKSLTGKEIESINTLKNGDILVTYFKSMMLYLDLYDSSGNIKASYETNPDNYKLFIHDDTIYLSNYESELGDDGYETEKYALLKLDKDLNLVSKLKLNEQIKFFSANDSFICYAGSDFKQVFILDENLNHLLSIPFTNSSCMNNVQFIHLASDNKLYIQNENNIYLFCY